jgi:ribosomal protein S18 acetylase RimI-like enzyme
LKERATGLRKPVTLDVMHGNRAKELYLRMGFKPIRANLDKTRMMWRPERR